MSVFVFTDYLRACGIVNETHLSFFHELPYNTEFPAENEGGESDKEEPEH